MSITSVSEIISLICEIRVHEKISRLCVQKNNFLKAPSTVRRVCDSYAPPLQVRTKVGASPISRLFYERELERFRSEGEAKEKRRRSEGRVGEEMRVKNNISICVSTFVCVFRERIFRRGLHPCPFWHSNALKIK